ncbi:hypothetical protein [Wolbachia endosymbiont (group B) of Cyclophora punctaria]|uniref:hypothetical protein n=1 Tax=Wolbachia endosymbiont (group B) of Cyclophora punctaria TaxID=3066168 RepID=UPI00333FAA34
MSDDTKQSNLKIIDEIEVKHRPLSFEKMKESNVKVSYVHKIVDKVVKDLNETFVPQLDELFCQHEEDFFKYEQALSDIHDVLSDNLDSYDELIANNKNYEELIEKFNDLRREIEELKTAITEHRNIDESKESLHLWHILVAEKAMPLQNVMELISA